MGSVNPISFLNPLGAVGGVIADKAVKKARDTAKEYAADRDEAKRIQEENRAAMEALARQQAKDDKKATAEIADTRADQQMKQKRRAEGPYKRDTILTSPLGVPGQATTAKKTLLGA